MATKRRTVAALAAWLCMLAATAQTNPVTPTVDERLAAAKVAEARGDLAKAEAELRAAVAASAPNAREQVDAALRALLVRAGRGEQAPAPQSGVDPIERWLLVLEEGSRNSKQVQEAIEHLESLDALVVAPLLARLPRMGPFGLGNALWLLRLHEDARIAPVLRELAVGRDPAVLAALVGWLAYGRTGVVMPLATELARHQLTPAQQCEVLRPLARGRGDAATIRDLVERLLAEPAIHSTLLDIHSLEPELRREVLAALADGNGPEKATATVLWAQMAHVTEDDALAKLDALPPAEQPEAARNITRVRTDWVRVAVRALQKDIEPENRWFADVAWESLPAIAGPALLATPRDQAGVWNALRELARAGWDVPVGLQPAFEQRLLAQASGENRDTFLLALPENDEARVLSTLDRLPASHHVWIGHGLAAAGRMTHRIAARLMAGVTSAEGVADWMVQRDWRTAPPETVLALRALVAKFPCRGDGEFLPWHERLCTECEEERGVPADLLLPIAARRYLRAWRLVCARAPTAAIAHARTLEQLSPWMIESLSAALAERGTTADAALLPRILPMQSQWSPQVAVQLAAFARRCASGDLALMQAIHEIQPPLAEDDWRRDLATELAVGVRPEQLPDLLHRGTRIGFWPFDKAIQSLREHVAASQRPLLVQHLAAAPEPKEGEGVVVWDGILTLLEPIADETVLPALRTALGRADLDDRPRQRLATLAVDAAGADPRAVLAELLASPHPVVVSAVVFRGEVGNDPDLRAKAREALLRHGDAIDWKDGAFAAWPVDPAAALATELLARDALLAGNSKRLLESAGALGRTKSAAVVPTLARLADHPNWFVRQRVANELGNTFSREAAPILLDMLKDLQEGVRKTAQASLDRIATYLDERVKWEQRLK